MRPKINGLTKAILKVLEIHTDAISWKQISEEIKSKGFVNISLSL